MSTGTLSPHQALVIKTIYIYIFKYSHAPKLCCVSKGGMFKRTEQAPQWFWRNQPKMAYWIKYWNTENNYISFKATKSRSHIYKLSGWLLNNTLFFIFILVLRHKLQLYSQPVWLLSSADIQAPAIKTHNVSLIHAMAEHEHICGSRKITIKTILVIEVLYFNMLVHVVTNLGLGDVKNILSIIALKNITISNYIVYPSPSPYCIH